MQLYAVANNPSQWEGMKMHILQSFVSQDHHRVLQAELQRMSRNNRETCNMQRFVQLANIVYPQSDATQTENLVKWLCVGLKDRDLVRRLMRRGRPVTLAALTERIHHD